MKAFGVCASCVVVMLLCSGCLPSSSSPKNTMQTPLTEGTTVTPSAADSAREASPSPAVVAGKGGATAAPTATPTQTDAPYNTLRFDEDNVTRYFQFGMSGSAVKARLKELRIGISEEVKDPEMTEVYLRIDTANVTFYFDDKNELIEMTVSDSYYFKDWKTAKGLKIGDSLETLHRLYGKEDEFDACYNNYIYYMNGYMFSINVGKEGDAQTVTGWRFFVNIHNGPSRSNLDPKLAEGNWLNLDEDNILKMFPFGMHRQDLINLLIRQGVRISDVRCVEANDIADWYVDTDHVSFSGDADSDRLDYIEVVGWDTAKGLKKGDSIQRLQQLYGKRYTRDPDTGAYIFRKREYQFSVTLADDRSDPEGVVYAWRVFDFENE